MAAEPQSSFTGGCLCGAVTYATTGEPVQMVLCHCNNCQRSSGTPFGSNLFFMNNQFELRSGKDKIKDYSDSKTAGGVTMLRSFCTECGSNVSLRSPSNPAISEAIAVPAGTLDEGCKSKFKPQRQFFCRSKFGWVDTRVDTQDFQEMT